MLRFNKRAARIVDRVLPNLPTCHGWYDREGFVEACNRRYCRHVLRFIVAERLRAKAQGGIPHLPENPAIERATTTYTVARRALAAAYGSAEQ